MGDASPPGGTRARHRGGARDDAEDGHPPPPAAPMDEASQAMCFLAGANSIFVVTSCSRQSRTVERRRAPGEARARDRIDPVRPGGEEASTTPSLDERFDELAALESAPRRRPGSSPTAARGPVDLVGNDLGLARDPRLARRARLEGEGAGGRAARLLGGGARRRRLSRLWPPPGSAQSALFLWDPRQPGRDRSPRGPRRRHPLRCAESCVVDRRDAAGAR